MRITGEEPITRRHSMTVGERWDSDNLDDVATMTLEDLVLAASFVKRVLEFSTFFDLPMSDH
jgi:hypothetical protein